MRTPVLVWSSRWVMGLNEVGEEVGGVWGRGADWDPCSRTTGPRRYGFRIGLEKGQVKGRRKFRGSFPVKKVLREGLSHYTVYSCSWYGSDSIHELGVDSLFTCLWTCLYGGVDGRP